jgi:hypothetical protein
VDGINLYKYSLSNPVRFIDLGGTQSFPDILNTEIPAQNIIQNSEHVKNFLITFTNEFDKFSKKIVRGPQGDYKILKVKNIDELVTVLNKELKSTKLDKILGHIIIDVHGWMVHKHEKGEEETADWRLGVPWNKENKNIGAENISKKYKPFDKYKMSPGVLSKFRVLRSFITEDTLITIWACNRETGTNATLEIFSDLFGDAQIEAPVSTSKDEKIAAGYEDIQHEDPVIKLIVVVTKREEKKTYKYKEAINLGYIQRLFHEFRFDKEVKLREPKKINIDYLNP